MDKKQIIKIDDNKFRIITPQAPVIEEISIKELENKLRQTETEKLDFEEKHSGVFDKQKEISSRIEELKLKIEEIKKI